jgi:hypothetical protein
MTTEADKTDRTTKPARRKRIARIGGRILLGLAVIVFLALFAVTLAPVRQKLLDEVVSRAQDSLPGTLTIGRASWPALDRLEFKDLLWTNEADTLVAFTRARLSARLWPLIRRDLGVRSFIIDDLQADLPAMLVLLSQPGRAPAVADRPEAARLRFPREGSLPGLPSLSLELGELTARALRLTAGQTVRDAHLRLALDLLAGHPPQVDIEEFAAAGERETWSIENLALRFDLAAGRGEGQGQGRIGPAWPFFWRLTSATPDSFRFLLSADGRDSPTNRPYLEASGRIDRDGFRLRRISYRLEILTPGTTELRAIPALAASLNDLADLEALRLDITGTASLQPTLQADARVVIDPNSWCTGGAAEFSYGSNELRCDSLSVGMPGLTVQARGTVRRDSLTAGADLRIRGTEWLQRLRPTFEAPDSLGIDLALEASGTPSSPSVTASLQAGARQGGFVLDRLALDVRDPASRDSLIQARLAARSNELRLSAGAEIERGNDFWVARLTPWLVSTSQPSEPDDPLRRPRTGTLRWNPARSELALDRLEIQGDFGLWRLDGNMPAQGPATARLRGTFADPPAVLMTALGLTVDREDSLRAAWRRDESYDLHLGARLTRGQEISSLDVTGAFRLPGPRNIAPILPQGSVVDDLGPLRGNLAVTAGLGGTAPDFQITCDLDSTAWLAGGRLGLTGHDGGVRIDTCGLAWENLTLEMMGGRQDDIWDLTARIDLNGIAPIDRFVLSAGPDLEATLAATASFHGTPEAPDLHAAVESRISSGSLRIPRLEGQASWDGEGVRASILAPEGADLSAQHLDSLALSYRTEPGGDIPWPGYVSLLARGPELGVYQRARLSRDAGLDLWTDSLAIRIGPYDLISARPFGLRLEPDRKRLEIDRMELAGDLGTLSVFGFTTPDSADLTAEAALRFPDKPVVIDVPPELWPARIEGQLRLTGAAQLSADTRVSGFDLGRRRDLTAHLTVESGADSATARVDISDAVDTILSGRLRTSPLRGLLVAGGDRSQDPISLDLTLADLPIPSPLVRAWSSGAARKDMLLAGDVRVRGTLGRPRALSRMQVSFPGWPKLGLYTLSCQAGIVPEDSAGTAAAIHPDWPFRFPLADPPQRDGAGLSGSFLLTRGDRAMMTGTLAYPGSWSLMPAGWRPDPGRALRLALDSEELSLNEFDPLLPGNVGLEGICRITASATGASDNPDLGGLLTLKKTNVSLADGSRLAMRGQLTLAGSLQAPVLRGEIEIQNGSIRLPEAPKNLLPARGEALLWEEERQAGQGDADTTSIAAIASDSRQTASGLTGPARAFSAQAERRRIAAAETETPVVARTDPGRALRDSVQLDMDIQLVIPSGLWLRGQGLEVELSGDLQVVQKGSKPAVTGELQALRGFFRLLGRTFFVERGLVSFYGEEELNPELDLRLACQLEATKFWVDFTGTLLEPKLALTSDPEMPEGDIMSFLLFGRPLNELNGDQVNLVQRRATDVVTLFGTAQLEARLSQQLGVDMVTIRESQGQDKSSSLVIGKYISRKALLTYEQTLGELSAFFINLEYYISRHFKLETLISRQDQSGIEFNWSYDY